jgi:outer membrane protein
MKSGLVFNIVLLVLVGVLFVLHFTSKKSDTAVPSRVAGASKTADSAANVNFRIAYFEMDSVTNAFNMVKDIKTELNREEDKMNSEMSTWQKRYNDKIASYQSQAQQMSQAQSENANRDILQMQETIRNKKQEMDQRYQNLYIQRKQDVRIKIEEFLKEYNRSKGYSYILGYEPGFIYYRDTVYNITEDLIRGLNSMYKKK